jgi:hypothetical protein
MEDAMTKMAEAMAMLMTLQAQNNTGIQASKVKLPVPSHLSGERDAVEVDNWLADVDHYFKVTSFPSDNQLDFAVTLFGNKAKTWWRRLQANKSSDVPKSWEELKDAVKVAFRPAGSYLHARSQFASLYQSGSVVTYIEKFEELRLIIGDVSDAEGLDKFVRGLKTDVATHVRTHSPKDIAAAQEHALAYDEAHHPMEARPRWTRKSGATPMELDYVESRRGGRHGRKENNQQKKNTTKKKPPTKKCWVCDEADHLAVDCKWVEQAKALKGRAQRK